MTDLLQTVNGIDVLLFALGAAIVAVCYELVLHRQRRRFDERLDATWDRAYDEGWWHGCRAARRLDRAIASVMADAEAPPPPDPVELPSVTWVEATDANRDHLPCAYCMAANAPDGTKVLATPHDACLQAYEQYAESTELEGM